jgi:hypothetical protein
MSVFVLFFFFFFVPVGCGSGTTGNNSNAPTWQYAALGDSLAAGALAQEGYVPRYATYLNTDTGSNTTTLNLGIPGWHSGDLLSALQNDPIVRNQVSGAEIVTWDIGGTTLQTLKTALCKKHAAARTTRTVCALRLQLSKPTGMQLS